VKVRVLKRFRSLLGVTFRVVKWVPGDFHGSGRWWELGAVYGAVCMRIRGVKLGFGFWGIFPPKFGVFFFGWFGFRVLELTSYHPFSRTTHAAYDIEIIRRNKDGF
jgi:hypothetical protein